MGHRAVSIRQRGLFANLAQSRDRSLRRNSRFAALPLLSGNKASGVGSTRSMGMRTKWVSCYRGTGCLLGCASTSCSSEQAPVPELTKAVGCIPGLRPTWQSPITPCPGRNAPEPFAGKLSGIVSGALRFNHSAWWTCLKHRTANAPYRAG
jgi:hypothetical protein